MVHKKINFNNFYLQIVEYHRIIKKPIALDIIRDKLDPENENHYADLKQVMDDIRLMFKNAFTYNPVIIYFMQFKTLVLCCLLSKK